MLLLPLLHRLTDLREHEALNLASIFEKLLDQKTFLCLRLVLGKRGSFRP